MKTIHKYPLPAVEGDFKMTLPRAWALLSVQAQGRHATMWAYVDTDTEPVEFTFRTIGTGQEVVHYAGLEHLGSVQHSKLVWHYFWVRPENLEES